jgi:hypothetical protein
MKSLRLHKKSNCLEGMLAGSGRKGWEKAGQGGHLISGRGCHTYLYCCHRIWRTLLQLANISQRNHLHRTSRLSEVAQIRKEDIIVWVVHKKTCHLNSVTPEAAPLLIMHSAQHPAVEEVATQKLKSTSRTPIIEDLYHKVTLLLPQSLIQGLDQRLSSQLKKSIIIRLPIKWMKRLWCRSWMLKRLPRESWFPLHLLWLVYSRSCKGF